MWYNQVINQKKFVIVFISFLFPVFSSRVDAFLYIYIYKDMLFIRKMGFLVPKAPKKESKDVNMLSNVKMLWCFPFSFHFFFPFEILMNKFDGREQWHCQLLEYVYLSLSSLPWFDVSWTWEALSWKEVYAKFMNRSNNSFGSSRT